MSASDDAHDPSARCAGTSPSYEDGEAKDLFTSSSNI
jgi:hypothetical protein